MGDPLSATPSGYTAYGGLGQYFISGRIPAASAIPATVSLVTSVNNPNWGAIDPPPGNYPIGSALQLRATPATNFRFVAWTNGASGTSNPLNITLQANTSIGAVFAEIVTTNSAVPYWWLASYGVTGNFESAVKEMGANGLPLWESYVAGLNPTVTTSQLRLALSRAGSAAPPILSWNTAAGRVYTLWSSTNVNGPFTRVAGASSLPASASRFTNSAAATLSQSFYRLEVSKP
jgi:hypothetical protein